MNRQYDTPPEHDPWAPDNLPKGMKVPTPESKSVSLSDENYSKKIIDAIKNIDGLDIEVRRLEVAEGEDTGSMVSLVLTVRRGNDD